MAFVAFGQTNQQGAGGLLWLLLKACHQQMPQKGGKIPDGPHKWIGICGAWLSLELGVQLQGLGNGSWHYRGWRCAHQ
jgi:hypothetical protein